ncbi:MAG TPA: S-methyl-5'-thioadenosine phosphorylase [Holophagaceae bacterium]|nr:S-methyl-5'-thioadenosine phosphorylase [Holophagaceae bacterium]
MALIGILGGSGLYSMEGVAVRERRVARTPFGESSAPLALGTLDGVEVAFLSRHGEGHRLLPSEVNYRANIWALKDAGAEVVLSVSAVGSLQKKHAPGTLRLPDQFIDRTHGRQSSFFGEGLVAHAGFAEPTCARVRHLLMDSGVALALPMEEGGTYLNMEGPQFSTRAESRLHQSWGADFVGMTQATEAKLAREAELCFACVALVTDYDAWKDGEAVETHDVLAVMAANVAKAEALLKASVQTLAAAPRTCPCGSTLAHAFLTRPEAVPEGTRTKLRPLIGKYGY